MQAYFNLDNGTGRILGIWGQGNTGAMKAFEQMGQAVKDLGWKNVSPRSVTQTDHGSFEDAGLPGFQFIQERLEYNSRTHHSNMDQFDHVQPDDVIQQGAVAASSRGRQPVARNCAKTLIRGTGTSKFGNADATFIDSPDCPAFSRFGRDCPPCGVTAVPAPTGISPRRSPGCSCTVSCPCNFGGDPSQSLRRQSTSRSNQAITTMSI